MNFKFVTGASKPLDYEIVLLEKGAELPAADAELLAFMNFDKEGVADLPFARKVYVQVKGENLEEIRLAASKAVKIVSKYDVKIVGVNAVIVSECGEMLSAAALAEGIVLGAYSYDKYKSEKKEEKSLEILVSYNGEKKDAVAAGLTQGVLVAEATNGTRDIVNDIPAFYTPQVMAEDAKRLAEKTAGVSCEVFGKDYLKAEGMNAFLAVNQSSPHDPALIHLTYTPEGESKGRMAFVGKGLTYDSGGLSLKPSVHMRNMKSDKGGAAAVLGIVRAAAELKLPYEVHGVLGCTENMIGADAYKPDDVVTSKAGVTIEVTNTDAEGRLVLADCLTWTCDVIKPDFIADLATLTGACVAGLGEFTSGVLGTNYDLQMQYKKLSEVSGEYVTVLESNRYLDDMMKSDVADVVNSLPGSMGGAITAGVFLSKFVREEYRDKWIHLDIAGPSFMGKPWGYNPVGASGAGVRGAIYYLMGLEK